MPQTYQGLLLSNIIYNSILEPWILTVVGFWDYWPLNYSSEYGCTLAAHGIVANNYAWAS